MKSKLTFLFILFSYLLYADGGDGYGTKCNVNDMEINYNLFYSSINGELKVINNKGKEKVYEITSNIAVYNIESKQIKYIFPDTLNERIYKFYYESYYDSLKKQIVYNRSGNSYYEMNNLIGNYNLLQRQPFDKLFIITYSYETKMYSLWTATKFGEELKRVFQFDKETEYYFDVKNMEVRFIKQINNELEISDIKY